MRFYAFKGKTMAFCFKFDHEEMVYKALTVLAEIIIHGPQ